MLADAQKLGWLRGEDSSENYSVAREGDYFDAANDSSGARPSRKRENVPGLGIVYVNVSAPLQAAKVASPFSETANSLKSFTSDAASTSDVFSRTAFPCNTPYIEFPTTQASPLSSPSFRANRAVLKFPPEFPRRYQLREVPPRHPSWEFSTPRDFVHGAAGERQGLLSTTVRPLSLPSAALPSTVANLQDVSGSIAEYEGLGG
ncbi:hypothetical protein KM043_006824 [Ampulex compressa]|nr:hypothetical protein KM043_006824 [Ampulex compressa]